MGNWWRQNKAALAIIVFLMLLLWGIARAQAADVVVGLGAGASHDSQILVQEVLLEAGSWEVGVMHMGKDDRIEPTYAAVASYRVQWRDEKKVAPWLSFGAAYFEHAPAHFVSERLTYRMGVGLRFWQMLDIGWLHYSTAGRADENQGLDYIAARVSLPLR